jgi:hypothetical protein
MWNFSWGNFFGVFVCLCVWRQGLPYVAQAGLELTILLPQPPAGWHCKCAPTCLADNTVLRSVANLLSNQKEFQIRVLLGVLVFVFGTGIKPWASQMAGKHCTTHLCALPG